MRRLLAASIVLVAACDAPPEDPVDQGPSHCQIVWSSSTVNPNATSNSFDVYVFDMPIEEWTAGATTYDRATERLAVFFEALLSSNGQVSWYTRAMTTSGSFSATAAQLTSGSAVSFSDDGAQAYFDLNGAGDIGAQRGTGGAGTFDGVWSGDTILPGSGAVTLDYDSLARSVGTWSRWAVCYDADATGFAPVGPAQRIERAVRSVLDR